MPFFNKPYSALVIKKMVFHILNPALPSPVLLEAMVPDGFADFFLQLIRSADGGAPYSFDEGSGTRNILRTIDANFQAGSEQLAISFHKHHAGVGGASTGAFFVFLLEDGSSQAPVTALLKYDDQRVVAYAIDGAKAGRRHVVLSDLEHTFVEKAGALQKSALIRIGQTHEDELIVLDRQNQQRVALYFEKFLGAKRRYEDDELTKMLLDSAKRAIKRHSDLVPREVLSELSTRSYHVANSREKVEANDQKRILESIVGEPLPEGSELVKTFEKELRQVRIDGVPVELDPKLIRPANVRTYTTFGGIQIRVPIAALNRIEVLDDRIIIHDRIDKDITHEDEPR